MLDEQLAATPRAQRALAGLKERRLNFDPGELAGASAESGWNIDDYEQALPSEPPGEPVRGGSFQIAQRLMRDYAFADPSTVRAVYDPAGDLADRNMLLQIRFGPLRMFFGCRVGTVTDETRTVDGRRARVWGWSYGTLAGHVERGQMDWTVWKWLDDGAVEFRIHVVSRRAKVRNPIIRLGFRLVGRGQQVRFARRACARMGELVARELERDPGRSGRSAPPDEGGAAQLRGEGGSLAQQRAVGDGDERDLPAPHPEQYPA
ncbi:MAG: DUF1990 family protein [Solirubrobacteraceae bacterium]|nr:DUF1990 family protein [Solirubrobacteraceae bacterium]